MILIIIFLCALGFKFLQNFIIGKYWNRGVDVKISLDSIQCIAGEKNILREVITNDKFLPLPVLHVKFNTPKSFVFENEENSSVTDYYYRDDVFSILGHQSVTRQLHFTCEKRGCFYLHDTNITSTDLFMQSTFTDKRPNNIIVHVYPKKVDTGFFDIPFNTITGNFVTQKTLIEDPFEFRGIREYQPYDNIRNINWKSSAKNNELKVNTYFMTSSQNVTILLNLDTELYSRDEHLVEEIISLASSISERFICSGIPVSVQTNGIDMYTKEQLGRDSGSGMGHMVSIDTALARIDTKADNCNFLNVMHNSFENSDENSYYIIISNNIHKEIIDYYKQLKDNGVSVYFIVPELKHISLNLPEPDMIKWNIEY